MITFQQESLDLFLEEGMDLMQKTHQEISERPDIFEFDPNLDLYEKLHKKGVFEIHTVRDDGKLIGYSLWFLSTHPHHKKSLTASSDILFLAPQSRKGMLGSKFIKWSIEEVKKRKPQRIILHVKPSLDFSPILERNGAHFFEKVYSIVLE